MKNEPLDEECFQMKLDPLNFFRLSNGCMLAAPPTMPFRAMFSEIVESKCYQPSPMFRIRSRDTVLDIGANVGLFSIWVSFNVPSARIFAFEAASDNYMALAHNVRSNHLKGISAHRYAVSDGSSTHTTLYRGFHGGIHSTRPEYQNWNPSMGSKRKTEKVRTISLVQIFQRFKINKVDFMKLDCEGAEYDILFSTPEPTLSRIRRIVGEYHDLSSERHGGILKKFLRRNGFKTTFKAAGSGKPWGTFTAIIR
jgi:FkbM family methyltransferase